MTGLRAANFVVQHLGLGENASILPVRLTALDKHVNQDLLACTLLIFPSPAAFLFVHCSRGGSLNAYFRFCRLRQMSLTLRLGRKPIKP